MTIDIDLLANNVSNDIEEMKQIFIEIFSMSVDDALLFDLSTFQIKAITEFKEYHGINVSIMSYLDKTKIPISIDIGFGDIITPERMMMEFPVLLDMESPKVYAYSISTVVAEKFEAIVLLGYANSRFKYFYDIYKLARNFEFESEELQKALLETFNHRKTKFTDIVAFEDDFINDELRKYRWNVFVKKKRVSEKIEFDVAMIIIKKFLEPIVDSINTRSNFSSNWDYIKDKWI